MGELLVYLIGAVLVAGIVFLATYFWLDKRAQSRVRIAQSEADRIIEEAETTRREAALAAKDEAIRMRGELDRELNLRRKESERIERRIEQKEESIDKKSQGLDQREQGIRRQEQQLSQNKEQWEQRRQREEQALESAKGRHLEELERVAGLSSDEAKQELVQLVEVDARNLAARRVHEIEREAKEDADRRSRKILATTIQRIATDYVAESSGNSRPSPK
jgi:ribonuclease Y